jgi:hypothetical protein
MGKSGGRNAEEVEKIVVDFERSGLGRREYCERSGIPLPTLDWYRRRVHSSRHAVKLARVRVEGSAKSAAAIGGAKDGFALVLGNGYRIETSWGFDEKELTRLIRVAGAA